MSRYLTRNWISWGVILLIAIGLPTIRAFKDAKTPQIPTTAPADVSADIQTQMMTKYLVGMGRATPDKKANLIPQIDGLGKLAGGKIAAAVVAGEVLGAEEAITRLEAIEGDGDATAFRQRYAERTPLPQSVSERYGYIADLAESNGNPDTDPKRAALLSKAQRTLFTLMAAGFVAIGGAVVAFALFITAIVLISLGKVRMTSPTPQPHDGSIYGQAFAIYLGVFVFGSLALQLADAYVPDLVPNALIYSPMFVAVALAAVWPILRGVSWPSLRQDWGLHAGRNILLEPLMGMAGYLAGLPVVAAGIGLMLLLTWLSGANVSHPIEKELLAHPLMMVLLAVVWAPITEELLFRGAFVSHLRVALNPWWSAVVSGLIFAAIHPQGWAAIPVLGSIGFVFAMVRQWRGTLSASIAAHALNNGAIVALLLLVAG